MTDSRPPAAAPIGRAELAALIDHTLLRPEASADDVRRLCAEGNELGVFAVCVSPTFAAVAARELEGGTVALACVVGFPSGAHAPEVKAFEAQRAVAAGAAELDMVIDLGLAAAGDWAGVEADIAAVREAAPEALLKVIIESAALEEAGIRAACAAAERAGADFVKTSTGFHPAGGASTGAVMAEMVARRLGVKASGGIRSTEQALAMLDAGATRLGLSATRAVLDGIAP
jgi:deoxyribose-phosphate aldolase